MLGLFAGAYKKPDVELNWLVSETLGQQVIQSGCLEGSILFFCGQDLAFDRANLDIAGSF